MTATTAILAAVPATRRITGPAASAWAVAGCLAALTAAKLAGPDPTLLVLTDLWHLPPAAADAAFVALIAVEAVLIALLLHRPWRTAGLLGTAAFLLIVSASPARQLVEGSTLGCGCNGQTTAGPPDHALALARNGLLLSLTLYGLSGSAWFSARISRLGGRIPLPSLLTRWFA